jgi:lipopolysaccharide/colanic/teichoic acid biosynthesis glycosyltransferase
VNTNGRPITGDRANAANLVFRCGSKRFYVQRIAQFDVVEVHIPAHHREDKLFTAFLTRVTAIGRLMRRTRLDELPQLWNVLIGDMSFVGPRPERPEFVSELTRDIRFYGLRHVVRPGLTGWAQVRYTYGATTEDALQKLQYDLYYIKNMTVALDVYIIIETVKTVLLGKGA